MSFAMKWNHFDANDPCSDVLALLRKYQTDIAKTAGILLQDNANLRSLAESKLRQHLITPQSEMNQTLGIHVFRPSEFDGNTSNDASLSVLSHWLSGRNFDWHLGSYVVQVALRQQWSSAGTVRIPGSREYVELDNLIIVANRKVAIEVETSNNLDNGLWTLRMAVRNGKADYGVIVVPWSSDGRNRADEAKAQGRLDREFDGSSQIADGPIYRIAIVRMIDVYWSCRE